MVAALLPSRASAALERVDDQRAHQAGVAEAHLGLGRVDVDVDFARRQRDEERDQRMAIARQIIRIGGADRADQEACRAPAGR